MSASLPTSLDPINSSTDSSEESLKKQCDRLMNLIHFITGAFQSVNLTREHTLNHRDFLLRAPQSKSPETPDKQHTRQLAVLDRFIRLAISNLNYAENALPLPETVSTASVGFGQGVYPPVTWFLNFTNLTIAMELLQHQLRMRLRACSNDVGQLRVIVPPWAQQNMWLQVINLVERGEKLMVMLARTHAMEEFRKVVIRQPMYWDWWSKLASRETWRNLLHSGQGEDGGYAVQWMGLECRNNGEPTYNKRTSLLNIKELRGGKKRRQEKQRRTLARNDWILEWREYCRGAPPPPIQVGIPPDNEVVIPVPVFLASYQGELEGRAKKPLFMELVRVGLALGSCEEAMHHQSSEHCSGTQTHAGGIFSDKEVDKLKAMLAEMVICTCQHEHD